MFEWCILEYAHISLRVGPKNLIFTNVPVEDHDKIKGLGTVLEKSILALQETEEYANLCLLDPKGEKGLSPDDAEVFDIFVLGGILGDHPMKGRTEKHFKPLKGERRSMGDKQMSTDTAVIVAHKVLVEKIPFEDLEFQDGIEIPLEEDMSNVFPYRYLIEDGKIVLTPGLIQHLKEND